MTRNPVSGPRYLLRGFGLILKPRIRRFVAVPLAINTLLFVALIYALFVGAEQLAAYLDGLLPELLDWLRFLVWPLFFLVALLVAVFGFTLVGNLIAAPFNGFLAEAVEQHLTGQALSGETGWRAIAEEVRRTLRSEWRKLLYTLVRALPILLLLLVPIINLAASVLWLVFGAWMLALQYADYPMGNHGLSFTEQRALLAQRRLLCLGFGASVMLALMVPVVNFLVIPASVAGATIMWVEELSSLAKPADKRELPGR